MQQNFPRTVQTQYDLLKGIGGVSALSEAYERAARESKLTAIPLSPTENIGASALAKVIEEKQRMDKLIENADRYSDTGRDFFGKTGFENTEEREIKLPEGFMPIHAPPVNPVHKTNETLIELLEQQKLEAERAEEKLAEARIDAANSQLVATKALRWTQVAVAVAVIATAFAVFTFFDGKASAAAAKTEAIEVATRADTQLAQQRKDANLLKLADKKGASK